MKREKKKEIFEVIFLHFSFFSLIYFTFFVVGEFFFFSISKEIIFVFGREIKHGIFVRGILAAGRYFDGQRSFDLNERNVFEPKSGLGSPLIEGQVETDFQVMDFSALFQNGGLAAGMAKDDERTPFSMFFDFLGFIQERKERFQVSWSDPKEVLSETN
jgi:hypothetical protein